MFLLNHFTSLQEVPNNLSLCFSVAGCPLHCDECSWKSVKDFNTLSINLIDFETILQKYEGLISCICFLGGEWDKDFPKFLKVCKAHNYKTCLYTGLEKIEDEEILANLDYLKTGPYKKELGGLQSKNTNQIFMDLKNNKILNHLFQKD